MKPIVYVDKEIRDFVRGFLKAKKAAVGAIPGRLERGEFPGIKMLGHQLKGAGKTYGFARISELGKDLDEAAGKKDSAGIEKACRELSKYLDEVEVRYVDGKSDA